MEAIKFDKKNASLQILDQLLLPHESKYESIESVEHGWHAIRLMKTRGAPAIAIVGVLSVCVEILKGRHQWSSAEFIAWVNKQSEYLLTSRPTAVNLAEALGRLISLVQANNDKSVDCLKELVVDFGVELFRKDVEDNKNIGRIGAQWLLEAVKCDKVTVLTHCNTGSLATAGYGTALGIIRALNERNALERVYCTETRPYNQGSRLTAYELVVDKLPQATLICDNMAAWLMKTYKSDQGDGLSAVIVGADRVAANGDTANKIGTYALALAAKQHGVKFIVAAPTTSIDLTIPDGSFITVEERKPTELTQVQGLLVDSVEQKHVRIQLAAKGINVWNPAFDITPASLIEAIVTEKGVFVKKPNSQVFEMRILGRN